MKKVVFFIIILLSLCISVDATSGTIRQSSVIKCGKKYYGSHGNPVHWHEVEKKDGKWVSVSGEVDEPSCYADIPNEKEEVKFNKCVDGDTLKVTVNGEVKTVRFLAIDTPESVHPQKEVEAFGKEASDYTCNLVSNAKKIYLEYDKNSEKEDKYGRLLAFVYADDKMVQKELVKAGLARVAYLYADYTYTSELQKLEESAEQKKVGIWSSNEIILGEEVEEATEKTPKNETFWDMIFNLLSKLIDKLFNLFESML